MEDQVTFRDSVTDGHGNEIRNGDWVRHGFYDKDGLVSSIYTTVTGDAEFTEIAVWNEDRGGPWNPKDVRKL